MRRSIAATIGLSMSMFFGAIVAPVSTARVAAADETILFVSGKGGSPPVEDRRVIQLLESTGLDVVVIDDADVAAADAAAVDAVVISSSIVPTAVGAEFLRTPVPVVVWEPYLFNHMKMTRSGGANRGEVGNVSSINIIRPDHPLAAGLSGNVAVTDGNVSQSWGRVVQQGMSIATAPGAAAKSTIFVYDAGAQMNGLAAPDIRIGLFPSFATGARLTDDGEALVVAAVDYALGRSSTGPVNSPPSLDAGPDQNIQEGQSVNLAASVSDDGRPGPLEIQWSGPSGVAFSDPTSAATTATLPGPSSYDLEISVTDGELTVVDTVNITVFESGPDPVNQPPTVSAGSDVVVDEGDTIVVTGAASDDGLPINPGSITTSWSGPSGVTFASPGATASAVTVPGPGTYQLVLTATDGALSATDQVTVTVDAAAPTGSSEVLYISASATGLASEQAVIQRLGDAGHTVTVVDDNKADPATAGNYDLVFVSASVAPNTFDDPWADAATPMVVAEPYVFDDMGFTSSNTNEGAASSQRDLKVIASDHAITAGYSGAVRVTTIGRSISWAKPGGDVRALATHNTAPDKVALFTYEQGAAMQRGTAPARRVGLFLAANAAASLTSDGWELFDRSIAWALATPQPAPTAVIDADTTTGQAPQTVSFSSAGSTGTIVDYAWDFGDGFSGNGPAPTHTYTRGGSYDVTLVVADVDAQIDTASITLTFDDAAPLEPGDDPIVRYDFVRSGDNRTVRDTSGVGTPMNLTVAAPGAVTWLSGGGLSVNNSTKIQSNGPATKVLDAVAGTGAMTVEAWIDPANKTQNGPARILTLSNGDDEFQNSNFMLGQGYLFGEGDRIEARFRTSDTTRHGTPGVVSRDAAIDGNLVHVVAARDTSGQVQIFVNGTLSTEWQISGGVDVWDPTTPLVLANEFGENRPWRGKYHLVQIYNRALTQAEVCGNLAAGPGRSIAGNDAPFACLEVQGDGVDAPATVRFDGTHSADIDGAVVGWSWRFGDGSTGSGRTPNHRYTQPGSYDVSLTVTDTQGKTRKAMVTVEITDPAPAPQLSLQERSGMRVGNGFFKKDPHIARENWLGREMNWTSQFTDHRSAKQMGSSSNGLFASRNAELPDVVDRMNVSVSVGLAFGDEDLNNGGKDAVARNLRKTIAGEYDFLYFRAASRMKDAGYGDAIIRLGHEFNGKWPPWASRGSEREYIAAYRHVHDLFQNVSPDFRFDWTAMKNDWSDTAPQAYPGDDYVDIVSLSVYWKGAGKVWDESVWQQYYYRPLRDARDFAIAHRKQVAYPEWGILRRNEPLFIDRMYNFFASLPDDGPGSMAYNVYWDSGSAGDRLDALPRVKSRYKQLFG